MDGIAMIAAERKRQVEKKGWTPKHDDSHDSEELARAAACYALPHMYRELTYPTQVPVDWPFEPGEWNPSRTDRVWELVRAGALIAAEIDRLQRLAKRRNQTIQKEPKGLKLSLEDVNHALHNPDGFCGISVTRLLQDWLTMHAALAGEGGEK